MICKVPFIAIKTDRLSMLQPSFSKSKYISMSIRPLAAVDKDEPGGNGDAIVKPTLLSEGASAT